MTAIDFACNDPDNGLFDGRVSSAMYGDIEFEAPLLDGFRFTNLGQAIRIHRRAFPVLGSIEWVGNWCWNRYKLERTDAKRLLLTMREHGWQVTCGPVRFCNWWNAASHP